MRKKKTTERTTYHISTVSRMFNIHPQTLRLYEREGLLKPSRSEGNTRLYTDEDLKRLEVILNLIRDLGVNLAGVEVILNMRQKMEQIEADVNGLLDYIRLHIFQGRDEEFERKRKSLVRVSPAKLVKVDDSTKPRA
jgi:MerR family transcriptional regulator/heat shock protein HspR